MTIKEYAFRLKKISAAIDWKLLIFLILFLNVKMAVKIPAIVLIYLFQFDFKFGFSFKNSRLPFFYVAAMGIAVLNWIIWSGYKNLNYNVVFFTGIGFWLLCILAVHQVKLAVEKNDTAVLHNTILAFFVLNAMVSVLTLASIIAEIHTINPYRYQGQFQKYFIGTGDYIKGITFDVSITNAVLNAFGVIYFLIRKNALMLLVCMAVLLLTGSNSVNLMLTGILLLLFIFKSTRDQKSLIVVCAMFLVVFMVKISPQNDEYVVRTYKKLVRRELPVTPVIMPLTKTPDSIVLSPEERKQKIAQLYLDHKASLFAAPVNTIAPELIRKPEMPAPRIHTAPFQYKDDTTNEQRRLIGFIHDHHVNIFVPDQPKAAPALPGKLIAMKQTFSFLRQHPQKILTGNGIGNFSSKLAFRATSLGVAGGFPAKYAYVNSGFLVNHLNVYLSFFSKRAGYRSLINSPNSGYDQLLSEYGLIGLLAFVFYYAGYFLKRSLKLSYGIPLLILMGGVFFLDYWFEQLSVLVFFELLLLIDMKEMAYKTLNDGN